MEEILEQNYSPNHYENQLIVHLCVVAKTCVKLDTKLIEYVIRGEKKLSIFLSLSLFEYTSMSRLNNSKYGYDSSCVMSLFFPKLRKHFEMRKDRVGERRHRLAIVVWNDTFQ